MYFEIFGPREVPFSFYFPFSFYSPPPPSLPKSVLVSILFQNISVQVFLLSGGTYFELLSFTRNSSMFHTIK